jgi:dienelactone hydrolase
MKIHVFLIALIVTVFIACSSNNINESKNEKAGIATTDSIPNGKVIDTIYCKENASQSYAIYLPKNYVASKTYPVVYAFDPHAEGKEPVTKYKELAEKYQYIIVGSNNSKNGNAWDESNAIANELFNDVTKRFSINTQRVYLLGFSGGARVANTLTILNGAINSVICCGAAAPITTTKKPRNNYAIIGLVGNEDFNYIEMKKYDMIDIAGHSLKHYLLTYDGGHEWPNETTMNEAFLWLEFNDMRKDISSKNETLINTSLTPLLDHLKKLNEQHKTVEAYHLSKKIINFYDGLAPINECFETYKKISASAEIDILLKDEEALWRKEEAKKQEYLKQFQGTNIAWWTKEITELNKKSSSTKNREQALMHKRILNFLSLVAYMNTSNAMKQNAPQAVDYYTQLYKTIDPKNKDACYFRAIYEAQVGNEKEAISNLTDAIANGFNDKLRLQNENAFKQIRTSQAFVELQKSLL